MAQDLLTKEQAAAQLGVSIHLIENRIRSGHLKVVRMGRMVRIRPAALDKLSKPS